MPASIGAGLALVVVAALGVVVHRPLAMVPENTLKFGVGVLLSAFGTFWVGEGIGLTWPGADWALLGLIVVYLLSALALVPLCQRLHRLREARMGFAPKAGGTPSAGAIGVVLGQLWGLFVDDIWLAGSIVALVGAVWLTREKGAAPAEPLSLFFVAGLNAVLALSTARRARE